MVIKEIYLVDSNDFPDEISNYFIENCSLKLCGNSVVKTYDNNDIFSQWLIKNGYKFKCEPGQFDYIAIYTSNKKPKVIEDEIYGL